MKNILIEVEVISQGILKECFDQEISDWSWWKVLLG
jgi:hypothetical protein